MWLYPERYTVTECPWLLLPPAARGHVQFRHELVQVLGREWLSSETGGEIIDPWKIGVFRHRDILGYIDFAHVESLQWSQGHGSYDVVKVETMI